MQHPEEAPNVTWSILHRNRLDTSVEIRREMPLMTSSGSGAAGSASSNTQSFWREKSGARPGRVAGAGGPVRGITSFTCIHSFSQCPMSYHHMYTQLLSDSHHLHLTLHAMHAQLLPGSVLSLHYHFHRIHSISEFHLLSLAFALHSYTSSLSVHLLKS